MTEPLRVLIIEDRPSDAELMVLRLEDEGFDPEWVRVETEAAYVAKLDAMPDLILSDWSLPRFSGLQALHLLRETGLDIPFVIVSGGIGEEAAVDAVHQGADDYVFKDRLARLGPAIRRALEAKRLRDERRRVEAQLRQAAMVFDSSTEGVTLADIDGTIIAVNRAFVEITGYAEEEVLGRNPRILQSGRQDETFYRDLWASLAATGRWRGEIWNRRKDGEIYPSWLTISAVKDEQGRTTHYVGVFSDIGDVKEAQQQLDFLANHDALTGLPNRSLLHDRLEQALRRAHGAPRMVGVVILDIDRFGKVNDGLGPGVGDGLLQAVAQRIGGELGASDSVARFGGDEFVVVVGYAQSAAHVARLAREFQDRLAMPFSIDGHEVVVTCCAGVSLYPTDGTDAVTLLRLAEAAMRQAKARGRNGIAFADVGLAHELEERLELERILRGAAARNELVVHYQPQVDMADRSLVGVEALVRWQHPKRGLVPPGEFIPLAEESGIIDEIGEWVLFESCRQMVAWQADGLRVPRVAVNLSAQQLGACVGIRHPAPIPECENPVCAPRRSARTTRTASS
jgi:diguanylate cyclase (GGDEF)-like protein/PAS domain S-box-containing protein